MTTLLRRGPGWPLLLLALLAAAPLAVQAQTGGVGIGTPTPSQKFDDAGNVRVGTVGEVLTTNTSNMLAVAYGQTGAGGTNVFGGSGNFSVAVVSTGVYTITFPASSGLSEVFGDNLSVSVSLFGSTPGFITYGHNTGTVTVSAFAMNGAPSSSYYFSFSAFTPSEAS